MKFIHVSKAGIFFFMLLAGRTAFCQNASGEKKLIKTVEQASAELKDLEKYIYEWGHAEASNLFIIADLPDNKPNAPFDVGGEPNFAATMNNVRLNSQAIASVLDQSSLGVQVKAEGGRSELQQPVDEKFILDTENAKKQSEIDFARKQQLDAKIHEANLILKERLILEQQEARRRVERIRNGTATNPTEAAEAETRIGELETKITDLETQIADLTTKNESLAADNLRLSGAGAKPIPSNDLFPNQDQGDGAAATTAKDNLTSAIGPPPPGGTNNVAFYGPGALLRRGVPAGGTVGQDGQPITVTGGMSLSESDLFKITSSAIVTQRILGQMANPEGWADNVQVYMAMTTVNVSPGWRTRNGYFCEVQIRPDYVGVNDMPHRKPGGKNPGAHTIRDRESPLVFAAFPVTEAQISDLSFSKRRQFELIMQLAAKYSAAGQAAQGDLLTKYLKRMEQDVQTKSMLPVVVPGSDGRQITYRFDPGLQALGQPEKMKTSPKMILNPVSTPALVVLVCRRESLDEYPRIRLRTITRWVPSQNRHWFKSVAVDWWRYGRVLDHRLEPSESLRAVRKLDELTDWFDAYCSEDRNKHIGHELESRIQMLGGLIHCDEQISDLPLQKPSILSAEWTEKNDGLNIVASGIVKLGPERESALRGVTLNGYSVVPKNPQPIGSTWKARVTVPVNARLKKHIEDNAGGDLVIHGGGGRQSLRILPPLPIAGAAAVEPELTDLSPGTVRQYSPPDKLRLVFKTKVEKPSISINGKLVEDSDVRMESGGTRAVVTGLEPFYGIFSQPGEVEIVAATSDKRFKRNLMVTTPLVSAHPSRIPAVGTTRVVINIDTLSWNGFGKPSGPPSADIPEEEPPQQKPGALEEPGTGKGKAAAAAVVPAAPTGPENAGSPKPATIPERTGASKGEAAASDKAAPAGSPLPAGAAAPKDAGTSKEEPDPGMKPRPYPRVYIAGVECLNPVPSGTVCAVTFPGLTFGEAELRRQASGNPAFFEAEVVVEKKDGTIGFGSVQLSYMKNAEEAVSSGAALQKIYGDGGISELNIKTQPAPK